MGKVATEATLQKGVDLLGMLAASQGDMFDGTKKSYDKAMKRWFLANGINSMTPTGITALCERWYALTRDGWSGYTAFTRPELSSVSTGTKGGDNADLTCTPSTDTVAGIDDYAGLPLFACVDVNYEVDPTSLDIVITAIKGITNNFVSTSPNHYVGVMQMSGWHYWYDTDTTYVHGYADHRIATGKCEPLPESVRVDGTIREFVVHSKYMNHTVDGKMTSYAGVIPSGWASHNVSHTLSMATGVQYSGSTTSDIAFLVLMTYIKYASLTLDGIMQGCCNFSNQYYAQVSESAVKRVIVPANTVLEEGCSVLIGAYAGNKDRGQAAIYSITGDGGAAVKGVEDITINEVAYKAVYVDIAEAFDSVANGDDQTGSTIISTFHWKNGITDGVLGNDGSYKNNTSGKYPYKLQGIEVMLGGYEVLADVIMNIADGAYTPHIVNRSANQKTAIDANYKVLTDLTIACPEIDKWEYIKRLACAGGVFYPSIVGGSSSTFTCDAFYMNNDTTVGTREWLAFGGLGFGAARAGLSCLGGNCGLGPAYWYCLARLSPNGNRGEWAA